MLVAVISSLLLATCYLSASRLCDGRRVFPGLIPTPLLVLLPPAAAGKRPVPADGHVVPAKSPPPPFPGYLFNLSSALPVPCTPADSRYSSFLTKYSRTLEENGGGVQPVAVERVLCCWNILISCLLWGVFSVLFFILLRNSC